MDTRETQVVRAWRRTAPGEAPRDPAPVVPAQWPVPPAQRAPWPEPRRRPVRWRIRRALATAGNLLIGLLAFGLTLAALGGVAYLLKR